MVTKPSRIAVCLYGYQSETNSHPLFELLDQRGMKYDLFFHHIGRRVDALQDINPHADCMSDIPGLFAIKRTFKTMMHTIPYLDPAQIEKQLDLSHSLWRSVFAKSERELDQAMIYDLVMVARHDVPDVNWKKHLENVIALADHDLTQMIYADSLRMAKENNQWSIDISFMAGYSRFIDCLAGFHHHYADGSIFRLFGGDSSDPAMRRASLGVLIWKWLAIRNLETRQST